MTAAPLGGWVAIHRQFLDPEHPMHPAQTGEPACQAFAWTDLVGMARWDPRPDPDTGIGRAQVLTSARELARRWNWSKSKAARWLSAIEADGMIAWDTSRPGGAGQLSSVLTVCNYDTYQPELPAGWDTSKGGGVGRRWDTSVGHLSGAVENGGRTGPRGTLPGGAGAQQRRASPGSRTPGRGTLPDDVEKHPPNGGPWDGVVGHRRRKVEERTAEEGDLQQPPVSTILQPSEIAEGVEDGERTARTARQADPDAYAEERERAPAIIREALHLGSDTVRVGRYDVGMGLELTKWERLVSGGVDPFELNGALSVLRHPSVVADVLPDDMHEQPITMAWVLSQPGVLSTLIGRFHKLDGPT